MPNIIALEKHLLWDGWSIELPPANSTRNEDGSWSAWGEDWVADVHIVEFSPADLVPIAAVERSLELGGRAMVGNGWVGAAESLVEDDDGTDVFRLAGTLAAPGSLLSCWISYFRVDQHDTARSVVQSVARANAT